MSLGICFILHFLLVGANCQTAVKTVSDKVPCTTEKFVTLNGDTGVDATLPSKATEVRKQQLLYLLQMIFLNILKVISLYLADSRCPSSDG